MTITIKVGSPGDYGPTGPQGPAGDRGLPGRTPGTIYFHHVYNNHSNINCCDNNFKNDILEKNTKFLPSLNPIGQNKDVVRWYVVTVEKEIKILCAQILSVFLILSVT